MCVSVQRGQSGLERREKQLCFCFGFVLQPLPSTKTLQIIQRLSIFCITPMIYSLLPCSSCNIGPCSFYHFFMTLIQIQKRWITLCPGNRQKAQPSATSLSHRAHALRTVLPWVSGSLLCTPWAGEPTAWVFSCPFFYGRLGGPQ